MAGKKPLSIIDVMQDRKLFARWFEGDSWNNWLVFLKALFCLPMENAELERFAQFTGLERPPSSVREAWVVVGRRGGKSLVAALVAVFLACFRDYSKHLGPGERVTIMLIAADRRQARVTMNYVAGFFENLPMLVGLIERRTRETIDLSNRVRIEIHTASFRTIRGYTIGTAIADEISFWRSEESASPDREIVNALRPGLATIPGSLLIAISSPYARRGLLWQVYKKHYGKPGESLVWRATSQDMNPTIPDHVIQQAMEEDEPAARAEWLAEFRKDIESLIGHEIVESCVVPSRYELPPVEGIRYRAFTDPSGGSHDSMTLAVAHFEKERIILDALREQKPPFSPEGCVEEFAKLLHSYHLTEVQGDRYAGEWPREQFRKQGIAYTVSEKVKSELYLELLPLLNSQRVELLENQRLIVQLCGLERRTARSGKDSIDHGPHSHDDLINAAAGAVVLAAKVKHHVDPATLDMTLGWGRSRWVVGGHEPGMKRAL